VIRPERGYVARILSRNYSPLPLHGRGRGVESRRLQTVAPAGSAPSAEADGAGCPDGRTLTCQPVSDGALLGDGVLAQGWFAGGGAAAPWIRRTAVWVRRAFEWHRR
jgi:hypothetical protein